MRPGTLSAALLLAAALLTPLISRAQPSGTPAPKADAAAQKETLLQERQKAFQDRDYGKGIRLTDQLITLEPKEPEHRRTKMVLLRLKDDADGLRAARRELAKLYAGSAEDLNNLAWDMVSDPELPYRDPEGALDLAQEAVKLSKRKTSAYLDTLARAYFEICLLDQALATQREAVAAATDAEDRAQTEAHMKYYERIKTLRDETAKKAKLP